MITSGGKQVEGWSDVCGAGVGEGVQEQSSERLPLRDFFGFQGISHHEMATVRTKIKSVSLEIVLDHKSMDCSLKLA
jgi:hypothetical protein